jgi:hypothetical protein
VWRTIRLGLWHGFLEQAGELEVALVLAFGLERGHPCIPRHPIQELGGIAWELAVDLRPEVDHRLLKNIVGISRGEPPAAEELSHLDDQPLPDRIASDSVPLASLLNEFVSVHAGTVQHREPVRRLTQRTNDARDCDRVTMPRMDADTDADNNWVDENDELWKLLFDPDLPPRWNRLRYLICRKATLHILNPERERHKIGRFEGLKLRGKGGFGIVFLCYDPDLDRNVAIKICAAPKPDAGTRVLEEARMLAKVSHPNVITVLETGEYQGDLFYVMEYVHGFTALDYALCKPIPTWQEIVDVYLAAGAGLAAAHAAGVVHGDFKPSNILVDKEVKWPRVADFGLARMRIESAPEHEREQLCVRAGTLPYMSPELLRNGQADTSSDMWAFCVSLWESIERTLPFVGANTKEMLDAIDHNEPRFVGDRVPRPLRDVLRTGLSKDPSDRYPDMDALLLAIEAAVRQPVAELEPTALRLTTTPPPPPAKNKGPGWGPFTLVTALAVGFAVMALNARQQVLEVVAPTGPAPAVGETASRCALEEDEIGWDLHPVANPVCELIGLGEIQGAASVWEYHHTRREADGGDLDALAQDTLIVARTFLEQAKKFEADGDHERSKAARREARIWAPKAASVLGKEHPGVQAIIDAVQPNAGASSH